MVTVYLREEAIGECVIHKLHHPPYPNPKTMTKIIDIYWKVYFFFDKKTGLFTNQSTFFNLSNAIEGPSHFWCELYSYPYTKVVGFVACRTTSKSLAIGSAEHLWSDVKQINDMKRSNLGGTSLEFSKARQGTNQKNL